jgi:hypothetical protein
MSQLIILNNVLMVNPFIFRMKMFIIFIHILNLEIIKEVIINIIIEANKMTYLYRYCCC